MRQPPFHQVLGQGSAHRFIVALQTEVSQSHIHDYQANGHQPRLAESVALIPDEPGIEQIIERIVDDVNGERDVAQKLADGR